MIDGAVHRSGVQESPAHRGTGGQDEVTGERDWIFSTQPFMGNVVRHKRPIVEQEVVFWKARGPGLKFASVWCFGRTCRPVFSVQLLDFLQGLSGMCFPWVCPCGSSYV